MKASNFKECLENNIIRKITSDIKRAESLFETAFERISIIKEINEKNANFVFEDYYTSILEVLQALSFKEGFNILNHLCLGYFLREYLDREDLYFIFDDLRYKRNSLTYYGIKMDFEIALVAIEKSKKLLGELKRLF